MFQILNTVHLVSFADSGPWRRERQNDRETGRQAGRETHRHRNTPRQASIQRHRHRHGHKRRCRHRCRHRQIVGQADRQTDSSFLLSSLLFLLCDSAAWEPLLEIFMGIAQRDAYTSLSIEIRPMQPWKSNLFLSSQFHVAQLLLILHGGSED